MRTIIECKLSVRVAVCTKIGEQDVLVASMSVNKCKWNEASHMLQPVIIKAFFIVKTAVYLHDFV